METNYNFQDIWKQTKTEIPNVAEIRSKANAFKKKQWFSSIWITLAIIVDFGIIIWVWLSFPDLNFLTKLGMVLILAALLIFIFQNFKKLKIINNINPALSNQEYLKQMKALQQKQIYIQTKVFRIYYFLLSLGMAFYLFEFAQRRTLVWGIFIYSVVGIWFLFIWFYIKPRRTRKQIEKISAIINSLEGLEKDLKS